MSYMKNTIDGEFVEEMVGKARHKTLVSGLVFAAIASGVSYAIGRRHGSLNYHIQMKSYLEGMQAVIDVQKKSEEEE